MSSSSTPKLTPAKARSQSKYGLAVWAAIIGFCLAALIGTYLLFVEPPPPRKIVIATGGKAGAYYQFAQKYAKELQNEGLTVEVRETKGSVENLQLLNDHDSGVEIAIVQSGVAGPEDRDRFQALGSLYREPLWVFYRAEKPLYVEEPPPKKIVIATGGRSGAYYRFGQLYRDDLQKEGLTVEVRETKGSVENLKLLADDKSGVAVALVQSGVADRVDRERLWALGSLYREPLWVFYDSKQPIAHLRDLKDKRVNIGPPGSGTYAIARQLLAANGLADTTTVHKDSVTEAAKRLKNGELDAAFFVASLDTADIKDLLRNEKVHLLSFRQHEAYQRQFRFLSGVTLPAGLVDLAQNLPREDVSLVAPTAMLVVRKDLHAALIPLLLATATRVHGKGDELSNPGEFPSAAYTDIPVSEEVKQFYKGGSAAPPRVTSLDRLSLLEGKRINVGPPGSGTYAIARQLLAINGLVGKTTVTEVNVTDAAKQLQEGKLDAAFFVAAIEATYVQDLMKDPYIRLLSFSQHEAYHRKFRFLSEVTLPAGLIDLRHNLPRQDIALVAPTAMLVVRKDFHPALVPLFLTAAARVHGKGDELSNPGEFPSAAFTDFPVNEDAQHFYKSGPPMLQRMLPFWLASLVDRLKIMLIPLVMLLLPLFRAAPPLVRWRTRRKIYLWYAALRDIDQKLVRGLSGADLDRELARLRDIEQQISLVDVPLSYMDEFYHLRLHLAMMQEKLQNLHGRQAAT